MSTYILQKDWIPLKAGQEVIIGLFEGEQRMYGCADIKSKYLFPINFVENNPEWFKLKDSEEDAIYNAVFIRNGLSFKLDKEIVDCVKNILKSKYTEEDMRNCFEESRHMNDFDAARCNAKYRFFEDYINSLNK